jgi:hypothetical protein
MGEISWASSLSMILALPAQDQPDAPASKFEPLNGR